MSDDDKGKLVELKAKSDRKKADSVPRGLDKTDVKAINRAFIEDEYVRNQAAKRSEIYVSERDYEMRKMPSWTSGVLWFVTGSLFVVALEIFFVKTPILDPLVRYFFGE